ncbi:helix-turn-helix transcriptional regulator [Ohtaekwangia koreensis]|jgi:predicted transcriptional regulator|uniref:Helix-turn-helix n=1 Tax=Ohtaekwangia koreensis TaxID=688867 RepID=A0A1T5L879_9BACT|nr:helix-turn-helix transcriptional regulator [Ohtaekwangia koreensis]SKC71905.1 hypothetical protein SAMN05660236_2685 [Ohtaekwangia koreensis]
MALHIGREIEIRYKESGLKLSEFAKRLNTSSRNVYDIFERSEIKTDQLERISKILNFNFFSLYQASGVQEALVPYVTRKEKNNTISIMVELDGQESTLNQWFHKLTLINKAMN